MPTRIGTAFVLALALAAAPAQAGNIPSAAGLYDFNQLSSLAKGMERVLAQKRVRVAVIGRVGLPAAVMPPGVRYSHAAFAVYSRIRTRDNRLVPGYAVYNLYEEYDRTGVSYLAQDYPIDYLADIHGLRVGVVIPNEKLQRALLDTIFSERYEKLHNPHYSALANPLRTDFQNCTGFVLDVIFAAIYGTGDQRRIKANIAGYFKPQLIEVDGLKLAFAAMFARDLSTTDHDGPIATATFESIARFLLENRLATESFSFTVDPATLYASTEKLENL